MPSLTVELPPGRIEIELAERQAPATCAYFSGLAAAGAFQSGRVFRIVDGGQQPGADACPIQIVQFGRREMLDAPRDRIAHESTDLTGLSHERWTVSAARFEPGELYGSFFVCLRDEPELDHRGRRHPDGLGFAAFGRVVAGQEIVRTLHRQSGEQELLSQPIDIRDITATA